MKTYSIIPAAGLSARMGKNKLLLPWPCSPPGVRTHDAPMREGTVLESVLTAWSASHVDITVIVLRMDSVLGSRSAEATQVYELCERFPIEICQVDNPPDMKASVVAGMDYLESRFSTGKDDSCFIAPADLPTLGPLLVNRLIQVSKVSEKSIFAPSLGDKLGHPALFRWPLLQQVRNLGFDQGVNALVKANDVEEMNVSESEFVTDIDSPDQYKELLRKVIR